MNVQSLIRFTSSLLFLAASAQAQTLVLQDNYAGTAGSTGFVLGSGVNNGINPPTTRLSGTAADNLRYYATDPGRAAANYTISGGKLTVTGAAGNGRMSLSADGTTPFDFGSALGTGVATALNPITYDIGISMANNQTTVTRFSFALGTAENNANFWDFGIQLYKASSGNNFYTIQKRIDTVSASLATDSSGSTGDINAAITTTASGTYGNQLNFLMRVTDAGAESTTFNSRIQVSMDGGNTWFYDTATDTALTSGFRFDAASRLLMWDTAGSGTGTMTYDNLSVTLVPEPSVFALAAIAALTLFIRRKR
jgi:hypothetical protein